MLKGVLDTMTFTAAISSGLVAGVFFAFSNFVMPALGKILPAQGIAAMNAINITVMNPLFMSVLFGTGLLCLVLGVGTFSSWEPWRGNITLIACVLYLVGCVGVTMLGNVPLNNALATAGLDRPDAAGLWSRYLRDWTIWNHVRTVASLFSAILFTMARSYG